MLLVAEVLKPGSLLSIKAVEEVVVAVLLTMITSQKSDLLELPLCLQVNVIFSPAGTTYPPGTRTPSAEIVATTARTIKGTMCQGNHLPIKVVNSDL